MKFGTVRRYALSMPEVTEAPHHRFGSFRVRGKIFATVPPEQTFIHVFVGDDDRERALVMFPAFVEKLLWGGKAVGLRIELAAAPSDDVKDLLRRAWVHKAPKALRASSASRC